MSSQRRWGAQVMENVLENPTSEAECDLGTAWVEGEVGNDMEVIEKTELRVCMFVSVNFQLLIEQQEKLKMPGF